MTEAESTEAAPSYEAVIRSGLLDSAGFAIAEHLSGPGCAVISDTNVDPLFGHRVRQSLSAAGFRCASITIPPGERSKTLGQASIICDQMVSEGIDRRSFVVGLGGGVIGDISGFVAAIYHRGIPHVQIPTTLLAMVDSSIGGKTGVNTNAGKNLLGAVHHPTLVLDDVDVLNTLPARELNQGFAEVVKHAIIADAEMFQQLREFDGKDFAPLVRRNVQIKASVVMRDEMDRTGERALLNFGHTVGHAIEAAGQYREFFHGEAVALGMVAACAVSRKRYGFPPEQEAAVLDLLRFFNLPTQLPSDFPRDKILEALPLDKKFEGGEIRFVVTPGIGSAQLVSDVTMDDIREAVAGL